MPGFSVMGTRPRCRWSFCASGLRVVPEILPRAESAVVNGQVLKSVLLPGLTPPG